MVSDKLSSNDYIKKYKPSNKYIDEFVLDFEGFVMYRIYENDKKIIYDYNKVKHKYYYMLHKIRPESIIELSKMPNILDNTYVQLKLIHNYMKTYDEMIVKLRENYDNIIKMLLSDITMYCNKIDMLGFNGDNIDKKNKNIIEYINDKTFYFKKMHSSYKYIKKMQEDLDLQKIDEQKFFIYILEIMICIIKKEEIDEKYILLFYRS